MFKLLLLQSIHARFSQSRHHDVAPEVKGQKKQEQGFSLLEVLVSILVLSGFFLGALQASVYATLVKVQAQDKEEITNWLQQDLQQIKYQAFILDRGAITPDAEFGSAPTVSEPDACSLSQYGSRLQEFVDETYLPTSTITIDSKSYDVTRSYTAKDNTLEIIYNVDYASSHPRYKSAVGADNTIGSISAEVLANASLTCS